MADLTSYLFILLNQVYLFNYIMLLIFCMYSFYLSSWLEEIYFELHFAIQVLSIVEIS